MRRPIRYAAGLIIVMSTTVNADPPTTIPVDILGTPVGTLRTTGDELDEVVSRLRDATGRDVFVNWKSLERIGVRRDLPMTIDLSGMTLGEAAKQLTRDLSGTEFPVDFAVDDGVLVISTADDLATNVETRTYDVRQMLLPADEQRAERLTRLIRRVEGIDPRSWKSNGGKRGSVQELGGQLIVTQTPAVHQRIAKELDDARAAAESDPETIRRREREAAALRRQEQKTSETISVLRTQSQADIVQKQYEKALIKIDQILAMDARDAFAIAKRRELVRTINAMTLYAQPTTAPAN